MICIVVARDECRGTSAARVHGEADWVLHSFRPFFCDARNAYGGGLSTNHGSSDIYRYWQFAPIAVAQNLAPWQVVDRFKGIVL